MDRPLATARATRAATCRASPRVALALFIVPALLLVPVKLGALWLLGNGRATLGMVVIVVAKVVGTAFVGRLFVLVESQLMQFAWFARAVGWWRATRERVLTSLRRSAFWRGGRAMRRTARLWLERLASWFQRTASGSGRSCDSCSANAAPLRCATLRRRRDRRACPRSGATCPGAAPAAGSGDRALQRHRRLDWSAEIVRIGRNAVDVRIGAARPVDRELTRAVTLALGIPANDRMDALVEKAGELGATAIQPLVCERSVLRLSAERAEAKQRHWSAVAAAASEQCGRARVTEVLPMRAFASWLAADAVVGASTRIVMSFDDAAVAAASILGSPAASSARRCRRPQRPRGGLTTDEESAAVARGFVRVGLGPRVLRADTAPLALLAWLGIDAMTASLPKR